MKKLILLLCCVLLVTSCNIFNRVDELCTVTTVYDQSKVTVNPTETIVSKGKTAKLTYTNIQGYNVTEIRVDGNPVQIPSDNTLYIPVNSDCVVEFISQEVVQYYTISASAGLNGRSSLSGEVSVPKNQSQTFDFTANDGYFVDSLYIDGVGTKVSSATAGVSYKFSFVTGNHTIRVTFRKKESYKIISSSSSNGVISPLGETSVVEGQNKTFQTAANEFCSLQKLVVDGVDVNSSSYTFSSIGANHTIDAVFFKELEWYLCKITWILDSLYIGGHSYETGSQVWKFSSDGTYVMIKNNQTYSRDWSLDKTTSPITLKCGYGKCKLILLNDQRMIISYIETDGAEVLISFKRFV